MDIPFPNKKYNIIYADPAWHYDKRNEGNRNVQQKYDTMTFEDIYNLPISDIADTNCILFLWVTYPKLPQCIETIFKWGFEYKTCAFSWVKKNKKADSFFMGMGNWTRANNEICLLATKGNIKRVSASVRQIVYEPIEEHSKKPNSIRDSIIELVGDLPRIELFARQTSEGWDSWGNEV